MSPEIPINELQYLLPEDIYLLPADKLFYRQQPEIKPAVAPPALEAPAEETPVKPVKYMGNNQKRLLVIASYTDAEFMPDAHLTALKNTLNRIGYTENDFALVNIATHAGTSWSQLRKEFQPHKLVLLGSEALMADITAPAINTVTDFEGVTMLYTTTFGEMMGNKEKITAFWNQIKTF